MHADKIEIDLLTKKEKDEIYETKRAQSNFVADFIKFYSPSLRVESPKKVKQWNTMTDVAKQQFADGIGKTLEQARRQFVEVRSGLKGTRKDTLAERIAGQLAFDATMQVIQGNEFASLRAVQGKPVLAQGRIKEIARRIDRGLSLIHI